jgi:hypothetical protein
LISRRCGTGRRQFERLDVGLDERDVGDAGGAGAGFGECEHFDGYVEASDVAVGADRGGGAEARLAVSRADVEHGIAGFRWAP